MAGNKTYPKSKCFNFYQIIIYFVIFESLDMWTRFYLSKSRNVIISKLEYHILFLIDLVYETGSKFKYLLNQCIVILFGGFICVLSSHNGKVATIINESLLFASSLGKISLLICMIEHTMLFCLTKITSCLIWLFQKQLFTDEIHIYTCYIILNISLSNLILNKVS